MVSGVLSGGAVAETLQYTLKASASCSFSVPENFVFCPVGIILYVHILSEAFMTTFLLLLFCLAASQSLKMANLFFKKKGIKLFA